jgi:hypothetical protein
VQGTHGLVHVSDELGKRGIEAQHRGGYFAQQRLAHLQHPPYGH